MDWQCTYWLFPEGSCVALEGFSLSDPGLMLSAWDSPLYDWLGADAKARSGFRPDAFARYILARMSHVHSIHIGLGGDEFNGIAVAPMLTDRDVHASISRRFRKLLRDFPLQFLDHPHFQGHGSIYLQWAFLCKTAGLLWLRSDRAEPDAIALLLNGVETKDELEAIAKHAPMFGPHFAAISDSPKPVAVNGYTRVSRMQDSAVVTVLTCFANVYFVQFGTNVDE